MNAWFWAWLFTFFFLLYAIVAFGKTKKYLELRNMWYEFQAWDLERKKQK